MLFHRDIVRHSFERLHYLQTLYYEGRIQRGSPEHTEILTLEELESLLVGHEMRRLYEIKSRLTDVLKPTPKKTPNSLE